VAQAQAWPRCALDAHAAVTWVGPAAAVAEVAAQADAVVLKDRGRLVLAAVRDGRARGVLT
jgi:hypothetical protein